MTLVRMLALGAMLVPVPAIAQEAAPVDTAAPVHSPRLTAARKLIDQIVPPEKRDAMVEQIVRPMMANMRQSFDQSPDFANLFEDQPVAKKQMLDFMDEETERLLRLTRESLPALFDAMAIAYARRFTLDQLADIRRFYDTPTGRFYAEQSSTIMADPVVQAAQRAMMTKSLAGLQDRVKAFAEKMQASTKKEGALRP